jgi:hypothetical protein
MANKNLADCVDGLCGQAGDAVRMIKEDYEGNKAAVSAIESRFDAAFIEIDRQLVEAVRSGRKVADPIANREAVMRFFENSAYDRPVMGKSVDQWVREDPSIIHDAKRTTKHPGLWKNGYTIKRRGYGAVARGVPGAVRKVPPSTPLGRFIAIFLGTFALLWLVFG